ncbi:MULTISPECIES: DUF5348 domain-containing protein [Paenibacillus]|uniref:DUF5348 domain-containing protein n=1 Tax=Paenibacillus TaxID=44249 RepID=UPI0015767F01|nr:MULTISPECIES: DUF5348 domain-containing protein [Paenibacillus]
MAKDEEKASDDRHYDLHCGEGIELYIGNTPIPGRLEMDRDWYVILHDVRFNLRSSEKYMVSSKFRISGSPPADLPAARRRVRDKGASPLVPYSILTKS